MRPISRAALGAAVAAALTVTAIAPSVAAPPDGNRKVRAALVAAKVSYSYDDGQTWTPAATAQRRGHWSATVNHAGAAGKPVTLRTELTDSNGNSVIQTVNDAYAVR